MGRETLPITKAQRRRIEYRARIKEQGRCIRALYAALTNRGMAHDVVREVVATVIGWPSDTKGPVR